MLHRILYLPLVLFFALTGCNQQAKISPSEDIPLSSPPPAIKTPTAAPVEQQQPHIQVLPTSELTPEGEKLIIDYEVGGKAQYLRNPHPEAPDARYSGVTQGFGYDNSTVKPDLIIQDWIALGESISRRLAATHPYIGRAAQQHLHEVKDITVSWDNARNVFFKIDVARVDASCKRAYPGFLELRPKAKDAVRSLVFNRGESKNGPTRSEMRDLEPAIKALNYPQMAALYRKMVRVWLNTEIYNGMKSRRFAEAALIETP